MFCLIGIGGYLTYVHYADLRVLCVSSGGCETVQSSRYSNLDGVPVAMLGLACYIAILLTLAIRGGQLEMVSAMSSGAIAVASYICSTADLSHRG